MTIGAVDRSVTGSPPANPRRRRGRRALRSPIAYFFVLPALAIFTVFTIGPTVFTFVVSLFKWNWFKTSNSTFQGLDNYTDLLGGQTNPSFWYSLLVTLYFVGAMVVGGTAISLALAVLLQRGGLYYSAVRSAAFLPHVTPLVATSIVWVWIFNTRYGLANLVLSWVGISPQDWLGSATTAMPAVIIFSLWHELGFLVVVMLGGLTTISPELSEAARIDGASPWKEFWYVTFPQLRPFVLLVVVITSVESLQAFTQFFVMTNGDPNYSTATLGFLVYQVAFVFHTPGPAAALAIVLFAITVALTAIQWKVTRFAHE